MVSFQYLCNPIYYMQRNFTELCKAKDVCRLLVLQTLQRRKEVAAGLDYWKLDLSALG